MEVGKKTRHFDCSLHEDIDSKFDSNLGTGVADWIDCWPRRGDSASNLFKMAAAWATEIRREMSEGTPPLTVT